MNSAPKKLYLVTLWIVALSAGEIVRAVIPSDHVEHVADAGHPGSRAPRRHARDARPPVRQRVVHLALRVDGEQAAATDGEEIGLGSFRLPLGRPYTQIK